MRIPAASGSSGVRAPCFVSAAWLLGMPGTLAFAKSSSAPKAPGSPSAAHERLGFFEGTWVPVGVPPNENFVETCAWLPGGRRHMVCRSRWTSPAGPVEGMSVLSYSVEDAACQHHGIRSVGRVVSKRGTEDNGVLRFVGEQGAGATLTRVRVTIKATDDGKASLVRETAPADGPWKAAPELRTMRVTR